MEIFYGLQLVTLLTVVSILAIWMKPPYLWLVFYTITLFVGFFTHAISPISFVFSVGIVALIWIYRNKERFRTLAFIGLIVIGALLSLHILPGFNNHLYLDGFQLSDHSAYFSIWFNYDKSLFGVLVLGLVFHQKLIRSKQELVGFIKQIFPVLALGLPCVYVCAILLGYVSVDITPSAVIFAWALKNLFFTVIAEEILFRGLIQTELSKWFPSKKGSYVSVVVAGFLFGLAHFAGGLNYVFLSIIAGCIYGYAYKITGRIEAPIVTHFLLNIGHFLFFSYPYLSH